MVIFFKMTCSLNTYNQHSEGTFSKKLFWVTFLVFISTHFCFSQNQEKTLTAHRVTIPPLIDGLLNDSSWLLIPVATDFIQNEPTPGIPSFLKTEVRIVYDNSAIYIGAMMYDSSPDSVLKELSPRDGGFVNADMFGILLDTYNDDLNGFVFNVSASGVQTDLKFSDGGDNEDLNWNAVWESKTKILHNGWIAEIKIPYSAIRFPNKKEQDWGIQFMRVVRRNREISFWTDVKPTETNFIKQSGKLTGIHEITSPVRLSFSPYISSGIDHYPYNIPGKKNYSNWVKGGLDLKYGINDAFTLDMTLVPDFGQVQADNKILNLSPFEVRYEEHRPFFTEGTELFNKDGLFYSRRIGAEPSGYYKADLTVDEGGELGPNETPKKNPSETQLINATKISGRNTNGLAMGFFNAVTKNTYAVVKDTVTGKRRKILTDPITNFNIIALNQTLKNGSYIGLLNTNVFRVNGDRNANVTDGNFRLVNRKNTYSLTGNAVLSQIFTPTSSANVSKNLLGHKYFISFEKIHGNFQFEVAQNVESDTYDPNDIGFLESNNEVSNIAELKYNIFNPFWKILKTENQLGVVHSSLYSPFVFTDLKIYTNNIIVWKNYLATGMGFNLNPIDSKDYFEPRIVGKYFVNQPRGGAFFWFSSDYRKRIAIDGHLGYGTWLEKNQGDYAQNYSFSLGPRLRVNDQMLIQLGYDYSFTQFDLGWVDIVPIGLWSEKTGSIFGKRNILTIKNHLSASYIFSNKMYLSLLAYHNWTKVKYLDYYSLLDDGMLQADTYAGSGDNNYNAFNLDLTYSWEFAPGSTLSIAWKNILEETENKILEKNYFKDFRLTTQIPQYNSISVKVLFYLDYQNLKKKI